MQPAFFEMQPAFFEIQPSFREMQPASRVGSPDELAAIRLLPETILSDLANQVFHSNLR